MWFLVAFFVQCKALIPLHSLKMSRQKTFLEELAEDLAEDAKQELFRNRYEDDQPEDTEERDLQSWSSSSAPLPCSSSKQGSASSPPGIPGFKRTRQ